MTHPFSMFDQVRVINLVDRLDRRREVTAQLERVGSLTPNIAFHPATRPADPGAFPSVGARGCFESHHALLRAALEADVDRLLIVEDDFDFTTDGLARMPAMLDELRDRDWSIFYGCYTLPDRGRCGLVRVDPDEPIMTSPFMAFNKPVIARLVAFLDAMLLRPAGSPDYGPMHVDGAYAVFRELNPDVACLLAFPALGRQRSSRSDITPRGMLLDRLPGARRLASAMRRGYNRLNPR